MRTKTPAPSLEEIRSSAEGLLAKGSTAEALDYLMSALSSLLRHNREMELLLAKLERAQVGRRSEKIDPQQLSLLFEELCRQSAALAETQPELVPDAKVENGADATLQQEIEDARKDERREKRTKKRSRLKARNVPQVHHPARVAESDRHCERCGKPKTNMNKEETTRVLEYVPGHFEEHVYHREMLACGRCKDAVTTAPGPTRILPRSEAGASLLAQIVVSKHADHSPLHRQHRIFRRSDVLVPVSTMSDWVAGVADMVRPIVDRLVERKARSYVIGTDATGLRVLDPDAAGNIVRGNIWCYVFDGKDVVFRYTPRGDGASGPWSFLADRKGYVQADGANVLDRLYNGKEASAVEVGCWSHARRKIEALKDNDCRTAYPLRLITRLFRIETLANLRRLDPDQRREMRRERSAPTLESLNRWVKAFRESESPDGALAKAAAYIDNQWTALNRFLEDGRLRLDNNLVYAARGINLVMPPPGLCRVLPGGQSPGLRLISAAIARAA